MGTFCGHTAETKKACFRRKVSKTGFFSTALEWARTINLRFRSSLTCPFAFLMLEETPEKPGFLLLLRFDNAFLGCRFRALVGGLVGGVNGKIYPGLFCLGRHRNCVVISVRSLQKTHHRFRQLRSVGSPHTSIQRGAWFCRSIPRNESWD